MSANQGTKHGWGVVIGYSNDLFYICNVYRNFTSFQVKTFAKQQNEYSPCLKEDPLVLVKTENSPATIIDHLAEVRSVVSFLTAEQKETFFSLSMARPELCSKSSGTKLIKNNYLWTNEIDCFCLRNEA